MLGERLKDKSVILSTEGHSCMDFPPRFAQFCNLKSNLIDTSVGFLKPIAQSNFV